MYDENKYPTMKYLKCRNCGNVFAMSLTGATECPDCASKETDDYRPGMTDTINRAKKERRQ